MASEIRVDKINSLSGVGTVTLSPTGVDISGITTVSTLKVGTGLTASSDGDIFFTGIATATTFSGSGASLTALPAGQLTGTVADARISTLTASKLSGALPAISALNLTNVPAANVVGVHTSLNITGSTTTGTAVVGGGVTISESGIEASGIGITCANLNGGQFGRRNKIINGAMEVAQRGTSSTSTGILTLDRMYLVVSNMDELAYAQKQTADGPDGFSKCFEFDVTTAESALDADDLVYLRYIVEAQDLTPLFNANGTGKDFVLSFYVKAYQAGTYQVSIYKPDNTIRFLTKTYTVDASATWQRVVIPFTGDTGTSGMNFDNGQGFLIDWKLVAGTTYTSGSSQPTWGSFSNAKFAAGQAVDVSTSSNNYWRITGIQLEVGSEATAFEHRSFGEELTLCQRYCQVFGGVTNYTLFGFGNWRSNSLASIGFPLMTKMRSQPSFSVANPTSSMCRSGGSNRDVTSISLDITTTENVMYNVNDSTGGATEGHGAMHLANGSTNCIITLTAEL